MRDGFEGVLKQEEWLNKNLLDGSVIGFDPNLISLDGWRTLRKELKGKSLVQVDQNLVDLVWAEYDKPNEPKSEILALEDNFSGKKWQKKVEELRNTLSAKSVYAVVISALDEVAWLFNMRGSDISFNPVFMSYAIVTLDNIYLFVDEARMTDKIKKHLYDSSMNINICSYYSIHDKLKELSSSGQKIWISSKSSYALASLVPEYQLCTEISPVCSAKAVKNPAEIKGMKDAHIRDGIAVCEYLCWLEKEIKHSVVDEITGANKLESFRKELDHFVSLSFETISGSGPNGAIIHYRPSVESTRPISAEEMYLCDSGAQYLDGTTDVTRTVHLGVPTQYQKECFTRVFKGHVQLAMMTFPKGTRGHILDVIARKSLWDCGLDFPHGTGHGVGAFLNVHEGPIGISPRNSDDPPLENGMFVTDEPGYYENDLFGIRIENVLLVKDVQLEYNFQNKGFLGFQPVTMVPIQKKLLVPNMLTKEEISWLNNYHEQVYENLSGILINEGKTETLEWLRVQTEPLG
ncbi:xaa-Pro aminopeptidase 1 isoform X2 [Hydra vulgaris]|uniref:Xaa-Pro aminopeptidase 1 isoform X2 n=1 Tax=Hydra vulgaris TaxID=6087 RepID=A0ABM4BKQ3_HYDVU